MWLKIAECLGLGFIVLALIGTPVVYYEKRMDTVTKTAYQAGYDKRVSEDHQVQIGIDSVNKRNALLEQDAATERLKETNHLTDQVKGLQGQLNVALQKANTPPICKLDPVSTGLLRSAARGSFDTTGQQTPTPTSGPTSKVS